MATRRTFIKQTLLASGVFFMLPHFNSSCTSNSNSNSFNLEALHDWKNRSIYFLMIDRFCNGDKTTDDFGKNEYNLNEKDFFHGGDLIGVTSKLQYIKDLGFDAIWITPPVYNQWTNSSNPNLRGYHGYWAYDFTQVDPHFGTLDDFKTLVETAHKMGIKVIQDIVVNHTGTFFTIDKELYLKNKNNPEKAWKAVESSYPPENKPNAPNDPVLKMNNPNIPEHKQAGVYNFTPNITNFNDPEEALNYTLSDLNDINLKNPLAAKRMQEIYKYWIETVGVDAFRIDTVYYTPETFYEYFLYNKNAKELGIKHFAKEKGKTDFLVFGEMWSYDIDVMNKYIQENDTQRLDSMIDFPLNEAIAKVFYKKGATYELANCLNLKRLNRNLWVNFLDSHDVERIFNRADWTCIRQSLVCLFTMPGIPCYYYGTENAFKEFRQDMFEESFYAQSNEYKDFVKKLNSLRKTNLAFTEGEMEIDYISYTNGLLSYSYKENANNILVIYNTSHDEMFYSFQNKKSKFNSLLSSETETEFSTNFIAKPLSYFVVKQDVAENNYSEKIKINLNKTSKNNYFDNENLEIKFEINNSELISGLLILINRNWSKRLEIKDLKKSFSLKGEFLSKEKNKLALVAQMKENEYEISNEIEVELTEYYELVAETLITEKTSHGVLGNLKSLVGDGTYKNQLNMQQVQVYKGVRYLKIQQKMQEITDNWNPPNKFDHLYFNVFFDIPTKKGVNYFPKLNYSKPDFDFSLAAQITGWNTVIYTSEKATKSEFGNRINAELIIEVEKEKLLITFYFPKILFDNYADLKGTKILISTWDGYLDNLRDIDKGEDSWKFHVTDNSNPTTIPKLFSFAELTIEK